MEVDNFENFHGSKHTFLLYLIIKITYEYIKQIYKDFFFISIKNF